MRLARRSVARDTLSPIGCGSLCLVLLASLLPFRPCARAKLVGARIGCVRSPVRHIAFSGLGHEWGTDICLDCDLLFRE